MMDLVEKVMSAFGGFGMDAVKDKKQKETLDSFNKLCLEFALKLDGSVGIENSDTVLKVVVQVAKHSDSAICDNFLRMLKNRRELYEKKNPAFLALFPVKAKTEYEDMDRGTKASIWAYFKSLVAKAEAYDKACKENPLEDLKKVKLDGLFGGTISKIKAILQKHDVDKDKMITVIGEVFDALPIDSLVEQVPVGALPKELGVNLDELKQSKIKNQICTLLKNVLND